MTNLFVHKLTEHNLPVLSSQAVETVQINLGRICNQACLHCHVEAGPNRTESMEEPVVQRVQQLLARSKNVKLLDITGGAPELNPFFRQFVRSAHEQNIRVMDRCNLTILFEEGQEDLADFLAAHSVEITASLPCYSKKNVEAQRGKGVFQKSIDALQKLNTLGYGTKLPLNLVYNPVGPSLPPSQEALEGDYRKRLKEDFDIEFTQLFTITNMPINRFAHALKRDGYYDSYLELLGQNFNPGAVPGVMCRSMVSISYDGKMYDCDFNQMLEMPVAPQSIFDIESFDELESREIRVDSHCLGCTAGAGSSCGGALA